MTGTEPLVVLLNGPLGIGKSTLGEALGEAIPRSVTLDGDALAALNPSPADELASLHGSIALLFRQHLAGGYERFVINHYWSSAAEIADLKFRLKQVAPAVRFHCFLLSLPRDENLRRIARRRAARTRLSSNFEPRRRSELTFREWKAMSLVIFSTSAIRRSSSSRE